MARDDGKMDKREPLPRDIALLLTEIEKEPVPERLLALARELQNALGRQSAEAAGQRKRT